MCWVHSTLLCPWTLGSHNCSAPFCWTINKFCHISTVCLSLRFPSSSSYWRNPNYSVWENKIHKSGGVLMYFSWHCAKPQNYFSEQSQFIICASSVLPSKSPQLFHLFSSFQYYILLHIGLKKHKFPNWKLMPNKNPKYSSSTQVRSHIDQILIVSWFISDSAFQTALKGQNGFEKHACKSG